MSVDLENFGSKIESYLDGIRAIYGYSYCLMKKDPAGGWLPPKIMTKGVALQPGESAATPFGMLLNSSHRLELGSTSKTITAVAVLHRIAEYGYRSRERHGWKALLNIKSKIAPFLPFDWKLGGRARQLTFQHLLEHTSALHETGSVDVCTPPGQQEFVSTQVLPGSLYKSMKQSLEIGPLRDLPDPCGPNYKNVNYALFRIILPHMSYTQLQWMKALQFSRKIDSIKGNQIDPDDAPTPFKVFLGWEYVEYVRKHVLGPAGVSDAMLIAPEPIPLCYDSSNVFVPGTAGHPNPILNCGGTGWKLSAAELCRFVARLTDDMYPYNIWNTMKSPPNIIGLSFPLRFGFFGPYLGKSGAYRDADNLTGNRAGWMVFPSSPRVVAALVTNFSPETGKGSYDAYTILGDAHELAIFT